MLDVVGFLLGHLQEKNQKVTFHVSPEMGKFAQHVFHIRGRRGTPLSRPLNHFSFSIGNGLPNDQMPNP